MIIYNNDGTFYSEHWRANLEGVASNMFFCKEDLYGDGLKYILTQLDRSQVWLSRETGIPPETISRYIHKVSKPSLKSAVKMHKVLINEIERQLGVKL